MNTVEFKGLGLKFNIDPIALEFLNFKIHWYGIIIATAFLLGIIISTYLANKYHKDKDIVLDLVLIATPFAIIGARLYYVIFEFSYYRYNLLEIFKVWHGGLAIYGAVLGALISVLIYSRYKKINILSYTDIVAPSLILGQSIGRWGNFINQEAYGSETNLPWAMTIVENGIVKNVHPTFLYESVLNFVIFIILVIGLKYKKEDGEILWLYIGLYSFIRFFIEGLRIDSLMFLGFRISQVLSMILFIFSLYTVIKIHIKNHNITNNKKNI